MKLFEDSCEVLIPSEYPMAYMPDWRHKLAIEIAKHYDSRNYPFLPDVIDDLILLQADYLYSEGDLPIIKNDVFNIVNVIYDGTGNVALKDRIEALLLTDLSLESIAHDLNMTVEQLWLYERLFFNIRDKNGEQNSPPGLKTHFAFGPVGETVLNEKSPIGLIWKVKAVKDGALVLLDSFGWYSGKCREEAEKSGGIDVKQAVIRQTAVNLLDKLYRGIAKGRELTDFFAVTVKEQDNKLKEKELNIEIEKNEVEYDTESIILSMLQGLSPKLLPVEVKEEEVDIIDKQLEEKAEQIRKLKGFDIKDKEEALAKLNKEVEERIKLKLKRE